MSDIDTYLSQLRSHLIDLDPERADEIVAEARTHLESRAAQLRATGVGENEAIKEALAAFGDPPQVAQDLVQGNARHRRPAALRAVGAFVTSFGSGLVLSFLLGAGSALSRAGTFALPAGLDSESTTTIVKWVAYCCIALLTGIVGGRRFWWIAGLPGVAMIATGLLVLSALPEAIRAEAGLSPLRILLSGALFTAMMAGVGWLASRLPRRRALSTAITIISGSVVSLIWVGLVVFAVAASIKVEDGARWYFGYLLATVTPVIVALLIAGHRDRFLSREVFIVALSGLCGLGLACAVSLAVWGGSHSALRHTWRPLAMAALLCIAGLLASIVYTVWTHRTATASLPPAESQ